MKDLKNYLDSDGWIMHRKSDGGLEGGDAAQRMFMSLTFKYLSSQDPIEKSEIISEGLKRWSQIKAKSFDVNGKTKVEPVRHPDESQWYGQPGQMSGDQLEAVVCFLLITKRTKELGALFWRLFKRAGFAWNVKHIWPKPEDKWKMPDWVGIRFAGYFMRYRILSNPPEAFLWSSFLLAADVRHIISVIFLIANSLRKGDECSDDLNCLLSHLARKYTLPTPISWLSRKIYKWLRPKVRPEDRYSLIIYPDDSAVMSAFRLYFLPYSAPPLDLQAEPIIKKEL